METVNIQETGKQLTIDIRESCADIRFHQAMLNNAVFNDIAMTHARITNANLSDLEIEGAQLGGAYIHNIGMPPKGHPMYNPEARQRPLRFEDCNLENTTFTNCNLAGIAITNCNLTGMTINGISVEALLQSV